MVEPFLSRQTFASQEFWKVTHIRTQKMLRGIAQRIKLFVHSKSSPTPNSLFLCPFSLSSLNPIPL